MYVNTAAVLLSAALKPAFGLGSWGNTGSPRLWKPADLGSLMSGAAMGPRQGPRRGDPRTPPPRNGNGTGGLGVPPHCIRWIPALQPSVLDHRTSTPQVWAPREDPAHRGRETNGRTLVLTDLFPQKTERENSLHSEAQHRPVSSSTASSLQSHPG